MSLRPASVRLRLSLWGAGVLTLILAAFAGGVFLLVRTGLLAEVGRRADQELAVVRGMIEEEPADIAEIDEHGMVALFAVATGGRILYASEEWRDAGLPEPGALGAGPPQREWETQDDRHFRLAQATVSTGERDLLIMAAADEEPARRSLSRLAAVMLLGFPAALGAALAGGWFLAGRLLAPVGGMASAAEQITAEKLSHRLPIENAEDEFGRLAGAFNRTLARLEEAFDRLRRFTADASHELRTPLTAMRSVGEVALRDRMPAEHYREVIGSMLEEVDRLTHLVDALLTLTRADSGAYRAAFEEVELDGLVRDVADSLRVLAEERSQTLIVDADSAIRVRADRLTLRQALLNLLDNAIKYSPTGGRVRMAVRANGRTADVHVADSGPGIAPEHHDRIFDRFYRVERDRPREAGGTGLGLAIARWAVELSAGHIRLDSRPGEGSTFHVILPCSNGTREVSIQGERA